MADRFATQLHIKGVGVGDFVAVYMTNSPEMVITLYALSKLGAVAAMINTNLRGMNVLCDSSLYALTVMEDIDCIARRYIQPLPSGRGCQSRHIYSRSQRTRGLASSPPCA